MSIWPHAMSYARPSSDVDFVSPVMACFVAVYGAENGRGEVAEMEPLLMIRPPRGVWSCMIRNASCVQRNAPVRLVSTTAFQRSRERSSSGTGGAPMPALLTSRSSRPNRSRTAANSARHGRGIRDVARHGDRAAADLGRRGLERLGSPAGQDHREPVGRERDGDGAADAAAGAGDHRDPGHRAAPASTPPSSSAT